MCYLVTWFNEPKSNAEINIMQFEEFEDDFNSDTAEHARSGEEKAKAKAEKLVTQGAKQVRLWKYEGKPTAETVVLWN